MKHTFRTIVVAAMVVAIVAFAGCNKEDNNDNGGTATARYTLTVQPNNAAWGITTGSGSYADGARVDIEAVANQGYYFIKWSDGAVSNPRTITVSSDITLYAIFSATPPAPAGWVDLGLPSGLLWASCNVGANSPEEYGDYFAWGDPRLKSVFEWNNCCYYVHEVDSLLAKYCTDDYYAIRGHADNLTILEPEDDAATTHIGNGARTPTEEEWRELLDSTTSEWTTQNGVYGRRFTAANGNSIFLPAAGSRDGSELYDTGVFCCYWSSSLMWDFPFNAFSYLGSDNGNGISNAARFYGQSVRAVHAR